MPRIGNRAGTGPTPTPLADDDSGDVTEEIVPLGYPRTGAGGTAPAAGVGLVSVGALAMLGAGAAILMSRRKRAQSGRHRRVRGGSDEVR